MPLVAEPRPGSFELSGPLPASGDADWLEVADDLLRPGTGVRLHPAGGAGARVVLAHDPELAPEAYRIEVGDTLRISAGDVDGLRHACQTVRQLLPDAAGLPGFVPGTPMPLPGCHIEDAPRFGWRGAHVDVARHVQPLPWLFHFVDLMALHRLNVLHLHLTDDQGWRFEVRAHPALTEVGSWRPETRDPGTDAGDGTPHGGFYTQDQLRSLVAHAASRGITVVPEIDVPSHVRALLAAHPDLGSGPQSVATGFGIFPQVLRLSDDALAMVTEIFTELLDVFPSRWIHVGGDEFLPDQWLADPDGAELAASRGVSGVGGLRRWFTLWLHGWLAERGRALVGWDEIVDDGPVPGAVVMAWRGSRHALEALEQGNPVVLTPIEFTYLDCYQSDDEDEPLAQPGLVTWRDVARFDPASTVPEPLSPGLLGVQGQLWTEYLHTPREIEYMAFPRLALLAEVGWRGRVVGGDLEGRLRAHLARLDAAGVEYRPLDGPRPWQRGGTGRRARRTWSSGSAPGVELDQLLVPGNDEPAGGAQPLTAPAAIPSMK